MINLKLNSKFFFPKQRFLLFLFLYTLHGSVTINAQEEGVIFNGLIHNAEGEAKVSINPQNELNITHLSTEGIDNVVIPANNAEFVEITPKGFNPEKLPYGTKESFTVKGEVKGKENQDLYTLSLTAEGEKSKYLLEPNVQDGKANNVLIQVYNEGQMIKEANVNSIYILDPINCERVWLGRSSANIEFPEPMAMSLDGNDIIGTFVLICITVNVEIHNYSIANINSVLITGQMLDSVTIMKETVGKLGLAHQGLGTAVFDLEKDKLHITNIGSSGEDGGRTFLKFEEGDEKLKVTITIKIEWGINFESTDIPIGAYQKTESIAEMPNGENQIVSTSFVTKTERGLLLQEDLSALNPKSVTLNLYRNGEILQTIPNYTGKGIEIDTLVLRPSGTYTYDKKGRMRSCVTSIERPIDIEVLGFGKLPQVDKIEMIPHGTEVSINKLKEVVTKGADIPKITIEDIAMTNSCPYLVRQNEINCTDETFLVCLDATEELNGVSGLDITLTHDANFQATGDIFYGSVINNSIGGNTNWMGNFVNNQQEGSTTAALYFTSNAPNTASLNGTGDLVCFEFNVNEDVDEETFAISASVEESYSDGSYVENCVTSGTFIVDLIAAHGVRVSIWGNSENPLLNDPTNSSTQIVGVGEDCNTQSTNIGVLDENGYFVVETTNGGLRINRLRNDCVQLFPNVEAFDIFRILQISSLSSDFIPNIHQLLAADVDGNGRANAGDATEASKNSLGLNCQYVLGAEETNPSDWWFLEETMMEGEEWQIDANYPADSDGGADRNNIPTVSQCLKLNQTASNMCEVNMTNIVAILKGDLDAPNNKKSTFKQGQGSCKLVVDMDRARQEKNNYHLPVYLESTECETINAFSFQISINMDKLIFEGIYTLENNFTILDYNYTSEGVLTVVAVPQSSFSDGDSPMIELVLSTSAANICEDDFYDLEAYLNGSLSEMRVVIDNSSNCFTDIEDSILSNFNFNVYPNPASQHIVLEFPTLLSDANVGIYNILGDKLKDIEISEHSNQERISIADLPKGIYLIQFSQGGQVLSHKKLIVK